MEGDKTVAQRPLLHRLLQDHLLGEDHHLDVVEAAQALQDLGHGLGFGFLGHGADPHHDLSLRGLEDNGVEDDVMGTIRRRWRNRKWGREVKVEEDGGGRKRRKGKRNKRR